MTRSAVSLSTDENNNKLSLAQCYQRINHPPSREEFVDTSDVTCEAGALGIAGEEINL